MRRLDNAGAMSFRGAGAVGGQVGERRGQFGDGAGTGGGDSDSLAGGEDEGARAHGSSIELPRRPFRAEMVDAPPVGSWTAVTD